uniref:Ig-like domain-containing protein n=1 Tax=Glossina pallidipes TaxID=7398 RepID=A0A1B0A5T1_GLOPL
MNFVSEDFYDYSETNNTTVHANNKPSTKIGANERKPCLTIGSGRGSTVKIEYSEFHEIGANADILKNPDSLARAQVNVEPNTAVLNEGAQQDLLCRYGRPITYCRIEIPGETKVFNLSPDWDKTPGFIYNGKGLQAGECGVRIEHVKAINNGQVKCNLGVEGEELSGTIDLVVALRPKQPLVELITKPDREGYFNEGSKFQARCIVRDGRPVANITWLLDNGPAAKRVGQLEVLASPRENGLELFTAIQDIQWDIAAEDNGRRLVCRSHHQTDPDNVPPQEGAYTLLVRYSPLRMPETLVYGLYLEHTVKVNMTIRANPAPVIEWAIDGNVIRQGEQNGRFSAFEPEYLGHDFYNVTLVIAGLTLEDTTKIYTMRATNALGSTDYTVRISSSATPPSAGLEIGAIVGIVVALAVLVLIVLLVLFARATGRWCFAGATLNTDIGPDSEAQINPQLNDEFDGREFNNGAEHIDTREQTEEPTPPVTDKLESQKKADIKSNTAKTTIISGTDINNTITATNGTSHNVETKTNTSV